MKNFDYQVKRITLQLQKIGFALAALTAVLVGVNYCIAQFRLDAIEEIEDIELKAAQADGANDSTPYFAAFSSLESLCYENPTQTLGIAATLSKKLGVEGASYLESLQTLQFEAEIYAESIDRQKVSCIDILSIY